MTEKQWDKSTDALGMVKQLRGSFLARFVRRLSWSGATPGLSERKLRLLLCGWSRLVLAAAPTWQVRQCQPFIASVEEAADSRSPDEWSAAAKELSSRLSGIWESVSPNQIDDTSDRPFRDWDTLVGVAIRGDPVETGLLAWLDHQTPPLELAELVRCLFGNPFRSPNLEPSWVTRNVLDLARTIYDKRAFERLPILADALMDAGCNDADILNHCRTNVLHARGCWVVDTLLDSVRRDRRRTLA